MSALSKDTVSRGIRIYLDLNDQAIKLEPQPTKAMKGLEPHWKVDNFTLYITVGKDFYKDEPQLMQMCSQEHGTLQANVALVFCYFNQKQSIRNTTYRYLIWMSGFLHAWLERETHLSELQDKQRHAEWQLCQPKNTHHVYTILHAPTIFWGFKWFLCKIFAGKYDSC